MTPEMAVSLIYDAVLNIILIVSVLVVPSLIVGLLVSIFQAATQINEQTLSFLPRLLVTLGMLVFAGNWMLERIMDVFHNLFVAIPVALG
ncbi:flagellar biosynthesis protein FliQ [Gallaecimonas pentaromativorans]|uniref:Flagellar biosynthetic protein FliQ n=1 Tax=Gallaecimonas pentaromativorans TaxID=584787 RepID=A0A3N1PMW4_9GAMM|nr:flagellar biosynthesis protein FliQ [Gallaecimonas pentaromativorans]MED5526518.1 flagellar biosynthesis protein FliQ [Pseudomonadota bacterium]ROQ25856.1 flagellar biosynthetic protein FliQ [Gallaecimonas pentaromativorans]